MASRIPRHGVGPARRVLLVIELIAGGVILSDELILIVTGRLRGAEEGPQGLRRPEEPRELVLHHRGQRELRRRARRAQRPRRDGRRDQPAWRYARVPAPR